MKEKSSILVVEDCKENIDGLRAILDEQYDIYVSINGRSALLLLQSRKPDLILLDVGLPDIDGFEVLKQLKQIPGCEHLPVIFITGETDTFDEERGLEMGAMDYIKKPYVASVLKIKVKNNMENKRYRDGLEKLVEERTNELANSREVIIMGMSLLAELRDNGTGLHIQRIKDYTRILLENVRKQHPELVSKREAEAIVLYSTLHDIGKVGISDSILLKKSSLTEEEFAIMKTHTAIGAKVLRDTEELFQKDKKSLETAIQIAESHHEKYDGTGYPNGLKGEDIPFAARAVALPDVYDALTSKREYKEAYLHDKAMDIILNGDGRTSPAHFDPIVLEAFVQAEEEFRNLKHTSAQSGMPASDGRWGQE